MHTRDRCLRDGMGGPQSMSCYKAIPVPKFVAKPSSTVRCSECAKWMPAIETLRFTAEEHVQAGSVLVFSFSSATLALRAPSHGTRMHACMHMYLYVYFMRALRL